MESRNFEHVYFAQGHEGPSEHAPFNYEILDSPELRAKYITLTEGLISKLVDSETDVAIFLDKSARPVAWLVNELWPALAPKDSETGEIPAKPEIKFLNIDREQWGAITGRSEDKEGGVNVDRIPQERIDELRELYAPVVGASKPHDETLLTGKNVTVIDEVRMSGDTLFMSEKILKRAFPDAKNVDGAYWMMQPVSRDPRSGAILGGEVPVWYSDRTNLGRLVANRDTAKSALSNSSRQRIGAYWLSTRFRKGPDVAGRQLKAEIKQLAKDFENHKVPYVFSSEWNTSLEPLDTRIPRLGGISVQQYVELRQTYKERESFIDHYAELLEK